MANNLPTVIKNCSSCEIIVVDDGSTDDSVDFLNKNFNKVKIIALKKNKGFAAAVNEGVKQAKGDLVALLNSDVSPQPNFLQPAIVHFNDDRIFAVGFADRSHEKDRIVIRGRGGASFEKGFINHFRAPPVPGETFWASGGSGLFDKQKFLELGGFDTIFAPFYWEDIDLCFRAWQKGYQCLFEPKSCVDHFHEEGAIKKRCSKFFIKCTSYKNQFLFVWKNISDPIWLIQHLIWMPYHFLKAIVTIDSAFIIGFFWALTKIPRLVFNFQFSTFNFKLTDREVLDKFAKP